MILYFKHIIYMYIDDFPLNGNPPSSLLRMLVVDDDIECDGVTILGMCSVDVCSSLKTLILQVYI